MNDIGAPEGLQVNPLETEPTAEGKGGTQRVRGNKILTSSPNRRTGLKVLPTHLFCFKIKRLFSGELRRRHLGF